MIGFPCAPVPATARPGRADGPCAAVSGAHFHQGSRTMLSHLLSARRRAAQRPACQAQTPWRAQPRLEELEDRCLLATFLVTTTADSGAGSLRAAIAAAAGDTNKP